MSNIDKKNIYYKYIYNLLDNSIDIDILSIFKQQATIEHTPVLYSIINVWHHGREIILEDSVLYEYENKLSLLYKNINNDMLLEFFRLVLISELDDLSIYIDVSEKLSMYAIFIYFLFYDDDVINPLVNLLFKYTNQHQYMIPEMYANAQNILGEGDMLLCKV